MHPFKSLRDRLLRPLSRQIQGTPNEVDRLEPRFIEYARAAQHEFYEDVCRLMAAQEAGRHLGDEGSSPEEIVWRRWNEGPSSFMLRAMERFNAEAFKTLSDGAQDKAVEFVIYDRGKLKKMPANPKVPPIEP